MHTDIRMREMYPTNGPWSNTSLRSTRPAAYGVNVQDHLASVSNIDPAEFRDSRADSPVPETISAQNKAISFHVHYARRSQEKGPFSPCQR